VTDAGFFTPALTTVRQDFAALAERCVAILDQLLRGEPAAAVRLRPELIVRESTALPRRQRARNVQ
jgi:LacI family transcriptional regulator